MSPHRLHRKGKTELCYLCELQAIDFGCIVTGLRRRMSQGAYNTAGAVFYGNHVATSMALGFLFYGAGAKTFNTSKSSVAALVISLFPRFPLSPSDNRCHLQASN